MQLILRALVAARDLHAAERLAPTLSRLLAEATATARRAVNIASVTPYPREPGWYECDLRIDSATLDTARALQRAVTLGWTPPRLEDALLQTEHEEALSVVWNAGAHPPLLDTAVQWAELLLVHD